MSDVFGRSGKGDVYSSAVLGFGATACWDILAAQGHTDDLKVQRSLS